MANCPKCGARLEKDDLFCPDCGAKMLHKEKKEAKKPAKKEAPKKGKLLREKILIFHRPKKAVPKKTVKVHRKPASTSYFGRMRERLPEVHPKESLQKVQPKSSGGKVFWTIVVIVVAILLFRSCISSSSDSKGSDMYYEIEKPEPQKKEIYKPEPEPPKPEVDKGKACSGVSAKITDACWSCGIVSCGLVVQVKNTGSKPILRFDTRTYINANDYDESSEWDPLDTGAGGEYYPYTVSTDVRRVDFFPIVTVDGEDVMCKEKAAVYGNAYGDGFGECGAGDWRDY